MPFGNQYKGTEVYLPRNCYGKALRILDLDNDGKEELLVGCSDPGIFVLYTRGDAKDNWTVSNGCNDGIALGDLTNESLAAISEDDYQRACLDRSPYAKNLCLIYNGNYTDQTLRQHTYVKLEGLTTVDLNKDGLMDLVATYRNGHTLFLQNTRTIPSMNRFIVIKLENSIYGIGATVILYADNCEGCQVQFREVSSHQHATDKWGYHDDRIIFGLGIEGQPTKAIVRWPNGMEEATNLSDWEFSYENGSIAPVVITQTTPASSSPVLSGETGKCQAGEGLWNLQLTTDNYGFETKWGLYSAVGGNDNIIKVSGGPPTPYNYADNTNYFGIKCLPVGMYYIRWYDLYGDGLCCDHGEGKWAVKVNGEIVLESDPSDDSFTERDFPFMVVTEESGSLDE